MAARAGSSPVQVVARAARYQTLRSMLAAVGAVIVTTLVVTAALVWPVGQHRRAACAPDKTSVSVYLFHLSLDVSDRWTPAGASIGPHEQPTTKPPADPRATAPSDPSGPTGSSGSTGSTGSTGTVKEPGDTTGHSASSGQRARVSGCVATTDLTPANPHARDGRG